MVKLGIKALVATYFRYTAKIVAVWLILAAVFSAFTHPYYISVTEVKHDAAKKSLQISCKMFTDNIENALKKIYAKNVDLLNPKDRKEVEQLLSDYISKHFSLIADGKKIKFNFIGYEKEEEAIWCYLEAVKVSTPKKISIEDGLLYEFLPDQINMVHVTVNEKRQSNKVGNPDRKMEFVFK
jgi:hypothetical protein